MAPFTVIVFGKAKALGFAQPNIQCANVGEAIAAQGGKRRAHVIGIVDGLSSRAIESEDDKQNRSKLLRDLGYKK